MSSGAEDSSSVTLVIPASPFSGDDNDVTLKSSAGDLEIPEVLTVSKGSKLTSVYPLVRCSLFALSEQI